MSSHHTVTLPTWDSKAEPDGWPALKAKIIDQYIDVIPDCHISVYKAMMFTVSDADLRTHAIALRKLGLKVYKAITNCVVDGSPAADLINTSKSHVDPAQLIEPGNGLKLVKKFDDTFGTSINQRAGKRSTQQVFTDFQRML